MEGLGNFITNPSFYKNIKNMIRVTDIQEKMLSLVGWEQNYDTSDFCIAEHLTKSESGQYFQGVHPLLTLRNLSCIAPDFKNTEYPIYDVNTPYKKGNIISYNDQAYKAVVDSVGIWPDNIEYWKPTDPFSEWLEFKTKASIQKAIFRFCNEKLTNGTHKVLCENRTLFDSTSRIADVVKNKSNLVGFEIVPIRAKGVVTKINKIGLHFTEPGDYTLYLMQSGSDLPIRKLQVTKTKKNTVEWFSFDDLYLPYEGTDIETGGSWYLCYLQDELPENSQAIRKDKDWSKAPCSSCSRKDSTAWQAWSKYLEIHPFYVNSEVIEKEGQEIPEIPEPEVPEIPEPEVPEPEVPVDPLYPVNVTISYIGATRIVLEWNAVDDAVGYNIYTSPNMPSNVLGLISTSHVFEGLEPDTDYYFDVSAVYPSDESNSSRVYVRTKVVDEVPKPEIPEPEDKPAIRMWDIEHNQYNYNCNYGLNLEVTVQCDITDILVEQRHIFQDVIAKQVAVDMLREFAYNANVRTNRHSINASRADILYELEGDLSSMRKSGLSHQLDMAFKAIELDTKGISRICLPCKNNGLKSKTI